MRNFGLLSQNIILIAALVGACVAAIVFFFYKLGFMIAILIGIIAAIILAILWVLFGRKPEGKLQTPEPDIEEPAAVEAAEPAALDVDFETVTSAPPQLISTRPAPPKKPKAPLEITNAGAPALLNTARDGAPDDLKQIKGVGPKLEQILHKMGIFHFDQIATWGAIEQAWVNDNLEGFKGRATRDNWVEQAKVLAAGGKTEFSKKVDKGNVY